MTEEQKNRWSNDVELREVADGGSSETTGEDSRGMSSKGLMEDDR